MKRIDARHHDGNLFQTGNPLTGQRGTRLDHTWLNAVQEELARAVEITGIELDPGDDTQLSAALRVAGGAWPLTLANALANAAGGSGGVITVQGHAAPGDGGGFVGTIEPRDDPLCPGGGCIRPAGTTVRPQMWGAKADGVTNDTAAMAAALAYALANGRALVIPGGTYLLDGDGAINFAGQGFQIAGQGKPVLRFVGPGRGFVLDTGKPDGVAVGEMIVGGFVIEGNAATTDAFYSRSIVRSRFHDIEVRECAGKAFNILHGVASVYDSLKYSTNAYDETVTPAYGLYLDDSGSYYTADCTFINPVFEGFPGTGIHIADGSGNLFLGGTSEGVSKGVVISSGCRRNSFRNLWCEANTTSDIEDYGVGSAFEDGYFGSNQAKVNVQAIRSAGARYVGGFIRSINLQATSARTHFQAVAFSDHRSLGVLGSGDHTMIGCFEVDIRANRSGDLEDKIGSGPVDFLPDFTGSGTKGWTQYATRAGTYVRSGRTVTFTMRVSLSAHSGAYGTVTLRGLPAAAMDAPVTVSRYGGLTVRPGELIGAEVSADTGHVTLYVSGGDGGLAAALDTSAVGADAIFVIGGTYIV